MKNTGNGGNVMASGNTDSAVLVICNNIIAIESNMQRNVTDTMQLRTLLATASIARYSCSYWLNQTASSNNPWNVPTKAYASVKGAVGADCVGGCAASISWGIGVAVWTGPAVGITWAACTGMGAICGSVAYGVSALWNWAMGE